jgi:LacI family transcriptional regulator
MKRRICLVAGQFDVTLAVSNGLAAWARLHEPWRIEVLSTSDPGHIDWLPRAGYSGVVVVNPASSALKSLTELACPVVCIQSPFSEVPTVNVDDAAIGAAAAQHLLDCGNRRFAFLGVNAAWSITRYEAFARTLKARQFTCMDNRVSGVWPSWGDSQSEAAVMQFLERIKTPVAVMACTDLHARVLADAAADTKRAVPEDVAIVGVDNSESLCESDHVTLSSVNPAMERVGSEAGRMLDQLLARRRLASRAQLVPPAGVVQRRSTNAAAFADPEVAAAIGVIRESACKGITVEEVCRHLSISRRQLERRFLKHVGRLPGAEIRTLRIGKARELLSETNLPLTQIAIRCGYEHLSSFSSAFREATGKTPSGYRRGLLE